MKIITIIIKIYDIHPVINNLKIGFCKRQRGERRARNIVCYMNRVASILWQVFEHVLASVV